MDIGLFITAFAMGWAARQVGLPPMVGYLVAGFALHALGYETTLTIELATDLGVLLLLFGIGLKFRLKRLLGAEVWGTTASFALAGVIGVGCAVLLAGACGLSLAVDLGWHEVAIVGFALSFSSTVFAVKALEETNETGSLAGRISIGILILQDILAVAFLVAAAGDWPSPAAVLLIPGIWLARPVAGWVFDRAGHGELLLLFGVTVAIGIGAGVFEAVGLKSGLGALIAGLALSSHPRSRELADQILSLKDLLLVAFFLSIGLEGAPSGEAWLAGGAALLLLPIRSLGLFWLLTRFRLRARTAVHGALSLTTFSEFGLIVGVAAVREGLLSTHWVSAIAVAVAGSFVVGSVFNVFRYRMFEAFAPWLTRFERRPTLDEDSIIDCGEARALVFGLGRVGEGAYDEIVRQRGHVVVGVDRRPEKVEEHQGEGRNVIRGDALDREFWERVHFHPEIDLVVASTNNHAANIELARRVKEFLPKARLAAIASFADEIDELHEAGIDVARNLYEEAGQALATDALAERDAGS